MGCCGGRRNRIKKSVSHVPSRQKSSRKITPRLEVCGICGWSMKITKTMDPRTGKKTKTKSCSNRHCKQYNVEVK